MGDLDIKSHQKGRGGGGVSLSLIWDWDQPYTTELFDFLAHLSRRLIGELIGYSWSGVRPASVRRRP